MLQPKQFKFAKRRKGIIGPSYENKSNKLNFGIYGIQALEKGKMTARQIEAVRRTITNLTKRQAKVWIRVFPDYPKTAKPTEIRMGRGKGNLDEWICRINKGRVLFEVAGRNKKNLKEILDITRIKFPFAVKIICKSEDLE